MADNVAVTPGSGASVAADEISGVYHQRVKVEFGADGTATDVSAAAPLPVAPIANQVGVAGGAGANSALTQRVTIATDDTVATDLTAIKTSSQLIDDAIVADDAAFTPATTKVMMAGFEYDDTTPDSVDEGDAGAARMSSRREVYTQIRDAAGNERGANVNASGQLAVAGPVTNAGTFAVQAAGDVAHDAADSGSPIKMGAYAVTALPTAVANQDRTNVVADKFGRQVVLVSTVRDLIGTQTTTISASTTETTIVTAAASVFNDLAMLVISNTSAATNTRIDFRDTTGGSVLFALQSNGGQPPVGFAVPGMPIPQTTVNTNWTAQCATSTTDIRIYAVFAKNR